MAADLQEDYAMTISELPPSHNTFPRTYMKAVLFHYDIRSGKMSTIEQVSSDTVVTVNKCSKTDFKYMVVAPVLPNGLALLGELTKFIAVSETRFVDMDVSKDITTVSLFGTPSEKVTLTVYNVTSPSYSTIDCVISDSGYATLHLMGMTNSSCS